MVATVVVNEWNGNSVKTDKTGSTVRFKTADNATVDTNNPITIPTSGQTHSFEKWCRMAITGTPPSQRINNLKFYTDGTNSYGTGITLYGEVGSSGTFRSAAQGASGAAVPLGGSGSITMTNTFVYTSGGTLALSSAAETFSGSAVDMGRFTVLVMTISAAATQGTLTAETGTFSYDEV